LTTVGGGFTERGKLDNFIQHIVCLMDNHTPEQRRTNMQAIQSKNTTIEIALRKELWSRGVRYRKNSSDIPGHPDIVFKAKKVVVFCDSEFWHGHDWESTKETIKSNREFWLPKIERNMERDREVNELLTGLGFVVIRFWGKEITRNTKGCADIIEKILRDR